MILTAYARILEDTEETRPQSFCQVVDDGVNDDYRDTAVYDIYLK